MCLSCRYAHLGDATIGYSAHAGKCPPALLLCVLHLWHYRSAAVGGNLETALHTGTS